MPASSTCPPGSARSVCGTSMAGRTRARSSPAHRQQCACDQADYSGTTPATARAAAVDWLQARTPHHAKQRITEFWGYWV
jgi:hypothetical protein